MRTLSILLLMVSAACQSAPKTEVVVLGMIHSGHTTSDVWGVDEVSATLRAIGPDAVLVEIPPDLYPTAAAEFAADGSIEEPRTRRFPEYIDVVFPLQAELGYKIVPCAGWTAEMASARSAKIRSWKTERPAQTAQVNAAQAAVDTNISAELGPDDDPRVIHTDRYDELVRAGMQPYDNLWNEDLGPGGWTNINIAHWSLLEEAIDAHPGQRLLITFGAWHKYWFMDQLRQRDDVELLDARDFLPQ